MEEKNEMGFFDGNPKMLFVFGLVTGVAITTVLIMLFGGGINNGYVAKTGRDTTTTKTVNKPSAVKNVEVNADIPPVTGDDHVRGNLKKAKVVMVEYSDFECPFCGRHQPNMLKAMEEYGDDIAWVYRHFPLSFHQEALPSANAAECAGEQGKFWEFADIMFENQDSLGEELYTQTAKDLKLNMKKYLSCVSEEKYADVIARDQAGGAEAGVSGTPATYINGVALSGAVPYAALKSTIDKALAE